jgi:DNA-binding CsgD family transcriptional regulator
VVGENPHEISEFGAISPAMEGSIAMPTLNEYRDMAEDCIRWAQQAHSDNARKAYIEMARIWTEAASKLDGGAAVCQNGHINGHIIEPLLSSESSSPTITDRDRLSPRERQVAMCLAHGKSNKEIARLCTISEATVKVYLKAILRKTRLKNRTQAAVWVIRHGFGDDYSKQRVSADDSPPSPTRLKIDEQHASKILNGRGRRDQ